MNQCELKCSVPNHNLMIQFVCFNDSCSEFRLACFECFQNGRHSAHPKDLKQMPDLLEYLKMQRDEQNQKMDEIIEIQETVNRKLEEYKQSIKYKFTIPTHKLQEINPTKINDVLTSSIKFKSGDILQHQSLHQMAETFIKSLDDSMQELNLNEEDKQNIQEAILQQSSRDLQTSRISFKPFQFKLIDSINEEEWCNSISFNKQSQIMIAGCRDGVIKIFEFKQGKISRLSQNREHTDYVRCIQFMKKTNSFISASDDKTIIVWNIDEIGLSEVKQKLIEHQGGINSLLINMNEDLIISGSDDKSIKFWMKQNFWSCQQTLNIHDASIRSMSLNYSSNQLISCAQNETVINVSQKQSNNMWILVQKIQQEGYRLCYIKDNIITVQPRNQKTMFVFKFNQSNNQFNLEQEVQNLNGQNCRCFFPQQFIKQKQLLVNKNGNYINLIRIKQNGEFILEQSIQFENSDIYGAITDDGEYLVTWDTYTNKLQVFQYQE
ncbi:unnamed protein product [Paramecium sonneborni]|uniref:Uncharacterized protein n=1 Tax=Paramecium sonneborni TaxID=65129 RepID=A0A8S1R234_9CILI|nr:unnamed protein product [Paramecium sonneborni]